MAELNHNHGMIKTWESPWTEARIKEMLTNIDTQARHDGHEAYGA